MSGYAPYYDDFACDVLIPIHAPITFENRDSLVCWIGGEVGWSGTNPAVRRNNPLNIKYRVFLDYGITPDGNQAITNVDDGTQGYGTFSTLARGAAATARYLSVNAHGYPAIIAALRAGASHDVILTAIAKSDWAASHYGYPRTNHLIGYYNFVHGCDHPLVGATPVPVVPEGDQMYRVVRCTTHTDAIVRKGAVMYEDSALTEPHSHPLEVDTALAHSGTGAKFEAVIDAGETVYVHTADVVRTVEHDREFV